MGLVSGPVILGAVLLILMRPDILLHPHPGGFLDLLFWACVLAVVGLLPVSVSKRLELTLTFPMVLALGMLYEPRITAFVTLVGAFDSREIRGEITPLKSAFNRSQIAIAALAGSAVFHSIATPRSHLRLLVPAVLASTAVTYSLNVAFVVLAMRLMYGLSLASVLGQLRFGALMDFLVNYLGLAFVGVAIAELYTYSNPNLRVWTVAAFVLPLMFARQMFFRTMALEEASRELKDRGRVLRALSNRMAEERQDERMQIAAYLHDDLAQMLFRLTLQVEMAKKRLLQGQSDAVLRDLDGISATKQETSDAIRALIRDLHRSPIGRKGLAEAIQSFAEDIPDRPRGHHECVEARGGLHHPDLARRDRGRREAPDRRRRKGLRYLCPSTRGTLRVSDDTGTSHGGGRYLFDRERDRRWDEDRRHVPPGLGGGRNALRSGRRARRGKWQRTIGRTAAHWLDGRSPAGQPTGTRWGRTGGRGTGTRAAAGWRLFVVGAQRCVYRAGSPAGLARSRAPGGPRVALGLCRPVAPLVAAAITQNTPSMKTMSPGLST